MALGHYIKEQMVKAFEEKVSRSHVIIFCGTQGLKAGEMDELRAEMGKEKVNLFLIKKTLAARALKKTKMDVTPFLNGDTFYAIGRDDPLAISKILVNFARSHGALKIKGGVIDKKIVDVNEIRRYASIPSREVLIQQLIFGIRAPMINLVSVLRGPLHKLILTLKAIEGGKK
ncbi:MAG: 50S ribosomal protein L10 [Candidatus Omnitrophica bacterium]|nr:50S ribosomal protein L10 [Candidatus Omnitrophota bacterium]